MLLDCSVTEDLENSLDRKKVKPVNSIGNQSLIFIESIDAEAEATILCPPDMKNRFL